MEIVRNYLLLMLLTTAPLISAYLASSIGAVYGCQVDESGVHPCVVHGVDVGRVLAAMFTLGWLALLTVPGGGLAIVAYTIKLLWDWFSS